MPFNPKDYEQFEHLIVSEVTPGFRQVQFNHPKTLNSFNERRWKDYQEVLEKLDSDPETVVILISSAVAKSFSSGLDLKESGAITHVDKGATEQQHFDKLFRHIVEFQEAIATPTRIDTPTICLVNGIAYGLAIDIASACTIRVAVTGAKLSIREIKIGIAADMGSLQRMPALVNNQSLLQERALTGSIWSAEDAFEWGFVSKVFPDMKSGLDYCFELGAEIASSTPWAVKGTKRFINQIHTGLSVKDGLDNVSYYNAVNIGGDFSDSVTKKFKNKL